MAAHAASAPSGGLTLTIRGTPYPVLLPKVSDPRLHLAVVITTLQVLGQTVFDFRLSIAQILISLLTCAVLEVAITFRKQRVLMWPASALLTGNGVAFILRVPGTEHGDWWSLHGWWIFAATAAVSLLSKYVIVWRGAHVFNPSNIGLVLCFLALGRGRAEPLDFWWGPMSPWLALAFAVIIAGGLLILSRLRLLRVAVGFWLSFAAGVGVLALTGHTMTAHWHLGPITGFSFWWVLLTSPEVLVFLFFMLTDPKTSPSGLTGRVVYAVSVGLLAALLVAPMQTEYLSKVALLAALAIVCALRPLVESVSLRLGRMNRLALAAAGALVVYSGALALAGIPARSAAEPPAVTNGGNLPALTILPSRGVQSDLDLRTARAIAADLIVTLHLRAPERKTLRVWLEAGEGQDPPTAVADLAGTPYRLSQSGSHWTLASAAQAPPAAPAQSLAGFRLTNVARRVGIDFRHGSFRFGVSNDPPAMMGGGVCWLDYDRDGRLDLFAVNSYADDELPTWLARGGPPTAALYRNDGERFVNVSASSHAGLPLRGEGCVAADLDGDGRTDLYVTTAVNDVLLWNNGDGTFTEGARAAGVVSFGWHSGAAVADVNRDGRPDLFVAGYTDVNHRVAGSVEGFPGSHEGVRDLLFLNQGHRDFREVGARAGVDPPPYDHSLGVVFTDANADGRPDLYVANDEDPNRLYVNERGGPLGFHFTNRARQNGVADPNAGMGIAAADYSGDGRADLFVSNKRGQTHAVYRSESTSFVDATRAFTGALGKNLTGWGDTWVDLNNDGRLDLVVANGGIPVTNLAKNAQALQVLAAQRKGRFLPVELLRTLRLNGRGVAAADYDNDGRMDLAVSSVGGPLLLLRNTGAVGHWLEVSLPRFAPGARVTAVLPDGRRLVREVHAGSSYLSSEDPRVHFGLGTATRVRELVVRYPDGEVVRLRNVAGDRIVSVRT